MGILNASVGAGGSANSASSWSNTAGIQASATAQQQAAVANAAATSAWREAAEFNAEQARIQREWQEMMENTKYQRTVKDMRAAGINPILAAQMGLGGGGVSSGATASMSPANTYMANTYAEQNSASQSSGESWNMYESGLMTALTQIMGGLSSALGGLSSGLTLNMNLDKIVENITGGKSNNGSEISLGKSENEKKKATANKQVKNLAKYGRKDGAYGIATESLNKYLNGWYN